MSRLFQKNSKSSQNCIEKSDNIGYNVTGWEKDTPR